MRHVDHLQRERPQVEHLPRRDITQLDIAQLVLFELRARHRDRQRPTVDGRHVLLAKLAHNPRQCAEMILMPVSDDDRLDVACSLAQVGEVGQHQVDADHLRSREAQADVDDDDPPVVLQDGHVLAYLPQPTEGQDTQLAHACAPVMRPWRTSMVRTSASSCSSASINGSRRPPTLWPSMFRAAFVHVGLAVMNSVSYTSCSPASISARCSGSSTIRRISSPTMWLETLIAPAPPRSSVCAKVASSPV